MSELIMNTAHLQKTFPEVYQKFFVENELVVSGCNGMSWLPGFGKNVDKIHIKQKVPTKTYCGITPTYES